MNRTMKAFLTAALATTLYSSGAMAANLTGAGGTAIYPVLQVWAADYQKKTGNQINYQAIGSGGGIKQIESKTVAFAQSDKPLMHDEIVKNNLVQFPQVMISIVPVVHLPGIQAGPDGARRRRPSPRSISARSRSGTIRRSRSSIPRSLCRTCRSWWSTARTARARPST